MDIINANKRFYIQSIEYTHSNGAFKGKDFVAPTEEEAEAFNALMKLLYYRNEANEGWTPDLYDEEESKYSICFKFEEIRIDTFSNQRRVLTFKNYNTAEKFIEKYEELILKVKPLL